MLTIEDLQKEAGPYKGTLVLDFDKVVLLKGVAKDDYDFYWVFAERVGYKGSKEYWSSCVMDWIPLKGIIPEKNYQRLVQSWNLNIDEKNQAQ